MSTTYTDYPFTAKGVNFISRVYSNSPFVRQIAMLPAGVFAQMNIQAVSELLTLNDSFTLDELKSELERVNEGATHAFILLGENN